MQHAVSIFIRDERDGLSIEGKIKLLQIPGNLARQVGVLLGCQVNVRQAVKLRVFVRRGVYAPPVLAELTSRVGNLLAALWRKLGLFSGSRIEHPQIAFVRRDLLVG